MGVWYLEGQEVAVCACWEVGSVEKGGLGAPSPPPKSSFSPLSPPPPRPEDALLGRTPLMALRWAPPEAAEEAAEELEEEEEEDREEEDKGGGEVGVRVMEEVADIKLSPPPSPPPPLPPRDAKTAAAAADTMP